MDHNRCSRSDTLAISNLSCSPRVPPVTFSESKGCSAPVVNRFCRTQQSSQSPHCEMLITDRIAPRDGGAVFERHCEEHSCPPKPAFGRRRMRRSNPFLLCAEKWIASQGSQS